LYLLAFLSLGRFVKRQNDLNDIGMVRINSADAWVAEGECGCLPQLIDEGFPMSISLNHTILVTRDKHEGAQFLTEILGLPPYRMLGHFAVVQVGPTSLDLVETDEDISSRHFAFLVSETEFDQIQARIQKREITFYADPSRKQANAINRWDDGRGLYFNDPSGHLLEIITKPYGKGGINAKHPNPLLTT
jgi:catechol 2,3-dioxygenase-like lactoylglutathione lyase family enzyme